MKNIIEKIKPLVSDIIDKPLSVSYRSRKEKSWHYTLSLLSILLAFASGSTTYIGLCELFHPFFAVFVMLGIQGLLFASSWRIGAVRHIKALHVNLWAIFSITLICSVFFSYFAIYDKVYLKESRVEDELNYSIAKGNSIMGEINDKTREVVNTDAKNTIMLIRSWQDSISSQLSSYYSTISRPYIDAKINYDKLDSMVIKEERSGFASSTSGKCGPICKKYKKQRDEYYTSTLLPLEQQLNIFRSLQDTFESRYSDLISSSVNLTERKLTGLLNSLQSIKDGILVYTPKQPSLTDIPSEIVQKISDVSPVNSFLLSQQDRYNINASNSISSVKDTLRLFISTIQNINYSKNINMMKYQNQVNTLGKYGGEKAHAFVLGLGGLIRFEPLSYLSLLIAVSIDLLILFCAFLGFPQGSFLDMEKPEELIPLQEMALEITYSQEYTNENHSSVYLNRISKFLQCCEIEYETAKKGYPASITEAKIVENNFIGIVGVLIALNLAKNDVHLKRTYVRLKLVLWLSEQIINSREKNNTASKIEEMVYASFTEK